LHDDDRTVPLPTYLIAWYMDVGLVTVSKNVKSTNIRILTSADNEKNSAFALDIACHCFEYFTNYFNVTLPITKLDFAPVPLFGIAALFCIIDFP
jgi:aminopeptidase N